MLITTGWYEVSEISPMAGLASGVTPMSLPVLSEYIRTSDNATSIVDRQARMRLRSDYRWGGDILVMVQHIFRGFGNLSS